ncbi:MAG: hypothetical protein V1793_22600 [Pseudomonadota bacterium]
MHIRSNGYGIIFSALIIIISNAWAGESTLKLVYPLDNTVFPPDSASPCFSWTDSGEASAWVVSITEDSGDTFLTVHCSRPVWNPQEKQWEEIKQRSLGRPAVLTLTSRGHGEKDSIHDRISVRFTTSVDPVDAPIFYRDVPLPFRTALMAVSTIEWRLGYVSSLSSPSLVLTGLPSCANCHSFPSDGSLLAMDLDYGSDKGSYIISRIGTDVDLTGEDLISWSDYRAEDKEATFGLLSQISPDGRYVISTVKDQAVQLPARGIAYSQLFFPIKGILVVYDRQTRRFFPLKGADDPDFVQSNPVWSPDGGWIVFTRAPADKDPMNKKKYLEPGLPFRYDLYRIPFNNGNGGIPAPLEGASRNGKSNFFPRYSPDGKWIVFCQAENYMLLQEDSLLYMLPALGGKAVRMQCNHEGNMNSWHSFSPNSRWLVFSSKINGPYTQLWLTHIDPDGTDSPAILLEKFISGNRAANIPEFVNLKKGNLTSIRQHIFKARVNNKDKG